MEKRRITDRRENQRRAVLRRPADRLRRGRLNVALVGAGLFGQTHVQAYARHPGADLKLVCDVNEEILKAAADTYACETCTDFREVAAAADIDAVSVATPDFLHREIVCAMLESGKHVLVEKPMATSIADARAMVEAARAEGTCLMTDFHNRFNPPHVEAKDRIESGAFGDPVMASSRLANTLYVPREMLSWAGKSGPQWFLFPHIVDLTCWLFGRQARRVTASGHKGILQEMGIDAYDAVQALVEFEDCSATFETCWVIPDSHPMVVDFAVTLFGSKQRIAIKSLGPLSEVSGGEKLEWPIVGALQNIYGRTFGWMLLPIMHFVDSILAGETPMVTPEEGFHNTAVICAIEQSIETGRPVDVEML